MVAGVELWGIERGLNEGKKKKDGSVCAQKERVVLARAKKSIKARRTRGRPGGRQREDKEHRWQHRHKRLERKDV